MRRFGWLAVAGMLVACSSDTFAPGDGGLDAAPSGPVTFHDKSIAGGTAGEKVTLTKPIAASVGDLLIAVVITSAGNSPTPPAGWAAVWEDANTGCSTAYRVIVLKGEIKAGDPAAYVVETTSSAAWLGALLAYANGSPAKVQLAQGTSIANNSTFKLDAIPTVVPGAAVVAGAASTLPTTGWPAGMNQRLTLAGGSGSVYDVTLPSGGSLPARTFETTDPGCGSAFQLVLGPR